MQLEPVPVGTLSVDAFARVESKGTQPLKRLIVRQRDSNSAPLRLEGRQPGVLHDHRAARRWIDIQKMCWSQSIGGRATLTTRAEMWYFYFNCRPHVGPAGLSLPSNAAR